MNLDRKKTLRLILAATLVLGTLDLLVWLAVGTGMVPPINNMLLWGAFALLTLVSIPWAISRLGLHPLVISLSYVAGGFIAFRGLQGVAGIHVAEVTTAGATYGAFGAMVVGNATDRVRLAFFDQRQATAIFIILFLLVFMALLNSEIIGSMSSSLVLNAVVLPFVLAGVLVGLGWTLSSRVGRSKPSSKESVATVEETTKESVAVEIDVNERIVFQMPDEGGDEIESAAGNFVPTLSLPEDIQFEERRTGREESLVSVGSASAHAMSGQELKM